MDPITQFPPRPPARGFPALVESLRDRATDPRVRVGALLFAAAVAGYFWYQVGQDQSSAALPGAPTSFQSSSRRTIRTTTTTKPPVLVHVAGAVLHPGLVRVPMGARVADAITAAGGGLPDADLDRLNLAAKVIDGQRIPVAKIGAPGMAGGTAMADGTTTPSGDPAADPAAAGPIDLNTATLAALDTLPGIGPSLAAAILRERDRRGGFTSVDQLREVRGIGDKRFADLKPLVSV
jgi:DNA uptake protein and related DNA-binding proteins